MASLHIRGLPMSWTDLFCDSSAPAWHGQVLLDCALDAAAASRCTALEAAIVSRTPTLPELCTLLDAFGVEPPVHLTSAAPEPVDDGEQTAQKNLPTDTPAHANAGSFPLLVSGARA
jgi:hypothetical protein